MDLNWAILLAGAFVGVVVGMTGMGGGALMTPMLVFFFGVNPLAAVSSDLVVSLFMKPVGGLVHLRRGTVDRRLVGWLCVGSVPAAFAGVLLLRAAGSSGANLDSVVRVALGVALLLAVATMVTQAVLALRRHGRVLRSGPQQSGPAAPMMVRPLATVLVGVLGGFVVGMTSVGSGSLIIVLLLVLYPRLRAAQLVGTDLVQAVPLVASAAMGHILFGDFHLDLTTSLLLGCVPGVWVGAHLSSRAPGGLVRRVLAFVLLASALKLLNVSTTNTGIGLALVVVIAPVLWMLVRRHHGFPALASRTRRPRTSQ